MTSTGSNLVTSTSEDNYFVDNGELVLRVTSDGNKNYTTPKSVTTRNIMSFKYGYLEMRAKVPYHAGMWPSFWMQPDKSSWNKASYVGEIDIFEIYGSQTGGSCNLHKWWTDDSGAHSTTIASGLSRGDTQLLYGSLGFEFDTNAIASEYHIYGFEWNEEYMAFYIDGNLYCKIDITDNGEYDPENHPGMDAFHKHYYICLNNWVFTNQQSWHPANDRVENLDDFAQNGIDYRIDYIRLYQHAGEKIKLY